MMNDRNLKFVANHYRKGAFNTRSAWRRMALSPRSDRRWLRYAAAAVAGIALTATATLLIHNGSNSVPATSDAPVLEQPAMTAGVYAVDFDNVPLPEVVNRIDEIYGVHVIGLPDDADTYRLTLHYEGDVAGLMEVINEILDTQLAIQP